MAARTDTIMATYLQGCSGKTIFTNRRLAAQCARRVEAEIGEAMNAYRCRACGKYHIGHTPGRKRRAS